MSIPKIKENHLMKSAISAFESYRNRKRPDSVTVGTTLVIHTI